MVALHDSEPSWPHSSIVAQFAHHADYWMRVECQTDVPNPVAVTAFAKRNAVKTSQIVRLLNPERTFAGGRVRVNARIVMATTTLTPIGTGCAIIDSTAPEPWNG